MTDTGKNLRKRAAPAASPSAGTGRLEFLRAINALASSQAQFVKAVENVEIFKAETLADLDRQLEAKRKDMAEKDEELAAQFKKRRLDLDLGFEQEAREKAVEILHKTKEVPIKQQELEELKRELNDAVKTAAIEKDKAIKAVTDNFKQQQSHDKKLWEMELATKTAELTAQLNASRDALKKREEMITQLQQEVTGLRTLVKEVAEASSKTVTQNFAGSKKQ